MTVFIELKSKMLINIEPETFKKILFITEPHTRIKWLDSIHC